jgi:hypothetical protein
MGMQKYSRNQITNAPWPCFLPEPDFSPIQSAGQVPAVVGRGPAVMGRWVWVYIESELSHPTTVVIDESFSFKDTKEGNRKNLPNQASNFPAHSLRILGMLLLPVLNPLQDPCAVAIDIAVLLAIEFHDDLLVKGFTGFFRQDAEDLGVKVLL